MTTTQSHPDHAALIADAMREMMCARVRDTVINAIRQVVDLGADPKAALEAYGAVMIAWLRAKVAEDEATKIWEAVRQSIAEKGFDA